jgi:hypothetical protein
MIVIFLPLNYSNHSSLIILPYQASKQHYLSLTTSKQISSIDDHKMLQFFKPYHQRQHYSLIGYFHISSSMTIDEIKVNQERDEWLNTYHYFIRVCPSQREEMVQIRALCYSSEFLYGEDLKHAIINHPEWQPRDPESPPIFDLYISDFNAAGKKTKMIFVSTEQSRQEEVSTIFKQIYNGTKKSYLNGSMMLFVPSTDLSRSQDLKKKKFFNYTQYIGEETLISIGGLQDLKTPVLLKNGKSLTICHLLKSLPASTEMSRPLFFQNAEPNISNVITMAIFQKEDHQHIMARQATIEEELCHIIAEGEEENLFIDSAVGIWFGGVHRNKFGRM